MKTFYFALKDGAVDTVTGEKDEAGIRIRVDDGIETEEEALRWLEKYNPQFAGRIRTITKEEYMRDYGDDEEAEE